MTEIKISERTIEVLKNFSTINQSIYVWQPGELKTLTNTNNIAAKAKVVENWPVKFAIYDLVEFLSAINLFQEPVLSFNENDQFVRLSDAAAGSRKTIRYYFADPGLLKHPYPKTDDEKPKDIRMPNTEINFVLDEKDFKAITSAASVLQLTDLVLEPGDNALNCLATNADNPSSNTYDQTFECDLPAEDFKMLFKIDHLKLMPGTYSVGLCKDMISHFVGDDLEYWISLNKESRYDI